MKGKQSDKELYRKLHHLHPFRYQCSEHSTDTEIEATYHSAIERQRTFEGDDDPRLCEAICTVLLDEAGFPDDNSMKVIHYHLDHAQVSSVILSNKLLDAAKTNRALQLFQSAPSHNDLNALARGCIFGHSTTISPMNTAILDALCLSFESSNQFTTVKNMFHLRDFVYFLRYLRKHCTTQGENFNLTSQMLLMGLLRNFNGVDPASFYELARMWFRHVNNSIENYGDHLELPAAGCIPSSLQLLKESLNDHLKEGENPNTAAFRYIMLIDPTDSESALSLLISSGLCEPKKTHFCSLGDFVEDTNDFVHMEAILKVKMAMSLGETVVLINAAPIFSSFYDVFNRHFTILRKDSPEAETEEKEKEKEHEKAVGYQYYANVAIGSFSRPCIVHPNFKVIVHVPHSSLVNMPLPFLNRFEKYLFSISDALKVELDKRSWQRIEVEREGKQSTVSCFDIIKEGCDDFVEQLHFQEKQGRLLYGVVPNETVASFMLSVAAHNLEHFANIPDITSPFFVAHAQSGVVNERADKIQEDEEFPDFSEEPIIQEEHVGDSLHEQLRGLIRRSNLRLLQLARPEMMFFSRRLSCNYVHEYLTKQEHFNLMRFLQHLIRSHFIPQYRQRDQAKKWCVFTRTCAELLRLHHDKKIIEFLVDTVLGDRSFSLQPLSTESVQIYSLHLITSSKECEDDIRAFAASKTKRILLGTVDMHECKPSQVNALRHNINKYIDDSSKLVVLVLHFPPEMSVSKHPCYHTIYLNHWDFIYIDSFGVETSTDSEENGRGQQPTDDTNNKEHVHRVELDARLWIAKAFGLDVRTITNQTTKAAFTSIFFQILRRECFKFRPRPARLSKIKHAATFYLPTTTKEARFEFMKRLFEDQPNLYDGMVERFSSTWSASLLHALVSEASQAIAKGQVVGSLIGVVRSSMSALFSKQVVQILRRLWSYYTLERIAEIRDNPSGSDAILQLVRSIITTLDPPPLNDLLAIETDSALTLQYYDESSPSPPFLPMYQIIEGSILRYLQQALASLSSKKRNPNTVFEALATLVEKDKMMPIISLIQGDKLLYSLFKKEFVLRHLRMPNLVSPWLDICGLILDKLSAARGATIEHKHKILSLFITKYFEDHKLAYFNVCLSPLQRLKNPPSLEDIGEIPDIVDVQNMQAYISCLAIRLLWQRLTTILKEDIEERNDLFQNWYSVFQSLQDRLESRHSLFTLLKREECVQYDLMLAICLYRLNFSLDAADTVRILCTRPVINAIQRILETKELSLRATLNFVCALATQANKQTIGYLLEDITSAFIQSFNKDNSRSDVELLIEDMNFFLQLSNLTSKEAVQVMWTDSVSFEWSLRTLYAWLQGKPKKLRTTVLSLAGEIIEQYHGDMAQYVFLHKWKESEKEKGKNNEENRCPLEEMLFFIFMKEHEAKFLTESLASACSAYLQHHNNMIQDPHILVHKVIDRATLALLVLQKAATTLTDMKFDPGAIIDQWPTEPVHVVQTLKSLLSPEGIKCGAPTESVLYFLSSFPNEEALVRFLKCAPALQTLQLYDQWFINQQISTQSYALFSFMIDHTTDMGQLYQAFKQQVYAANQAQFIAFIQATLQNDQQSRKRNILRMFLTLVCYYDFFNRNVACDFILQQLSNPPISPLTQLLDINAQECVAFKLLASAPPPAVDDILDGLQFLFSREARQDQPGQPKRDITIANLMVNCLAVALGSPRDSNHIYTRVFNPGALSGTCGPGSDHQHMNYDCGYRVDEKGELSCYTNPPIMGNHRRYRLAINSLVWLPLGWCCLLDPQGYRICVTNSHFLNYWKDDGNIRFRDGGQQRTEEQKVRAYILDRASSFCVYAPTKKCLIGAWMECISLPRHCTSCGQLSITRRVALLPLKQF